ncbi:MAG: pilus assembly protein TadG-related protein [Acidimicrobiales bacterium]
MLSGIPRAMGGLEDRGSITAFSVLLLVAIFVVMGMVLDGGTQASAHQSAVDEAEQAARAGAGALSVAALRSGSVQLNDQQAVAVAEALTVASGHPGTATVVGQTVTVDVQYRVPTAILGIVGITSLPVSASASADDVAGITGAP